MFDKRICGNLSKDIQNALKSVEEKYGIQITIRGGTFTANEFKPKLVCNVVGDNGTNQQHVENWLKYAVYDGFKVSDFGRTFKNGGFVFKITGYLPRRHKNPILATRNDGKEFVFGVETVRKLLDIK